MSSSIVYDPQSHTIVVTLVGSIDELEMNEAAAEVVRLAKQHVCFNVLGDLREAVFAVSTIALFGQAQEFEQAYGPNSQAKRALVVAGHSEDVLFYETVSRNRGQNVRLFYDIEEARRWLSS